MGRAPRRYWARFENVFGESFETHNPLDPWQSATFKRLSVPGFAATAFFPKRSIPRAESRMRGVLTRSESRDRTAAGRGRLRRCGNDLAAIPSRHALPIPFSVPVSRRASPVTRAWGVCQYPRCPDGAPPGQSYCPAHEAERLARKASGSAPYGSRHGARCQLLNVQRTHTAHDVVSQPRSPTIAMASTSSTSIAQLRSRACVALVTLASTPPRAIATGGGVHPRAETSRRGQIARQEKNPRNRVLRDGSGRLRPSPGLGRAPGQRSRGPGPDRRGRSGPLRPPRRPSRGSRRTSPGLERPFRGPLRAWRTDARRLGRLGGPAGRRREPSGGSPGPRPGLRASPGAETGPEGPAQAPQRP